MRVAEKTPRAAPAAFIPAGDDDRAPRSGQRRVIEAQPSVPLRWPTTTKARRDLFDAWHQIGMQVVHEAGVSFRLMALIERFVNWQTGDLWPSNETLARRAGGCDESTVKRDIGLYQKLGLLRVELGCRRQRGGRLVRKRTIHLAVPIGFDGTLMDAVEGGNRGADGDDDQGGNRGPDQGGNRGPDTFEGTLDSAEEVDRAA